MKGLITGFGSPGGTRTPGKVVNSHLLYQLSYRGTANGTIYFLSRPKSILFFTFGPFPLFRGLFSGFFSRRRAKGFGQFDYFFIFQINPGFDLGHSVGI